MLTCVVWREQNALTTILLTLVADTKRTLQLRHRMATQTNSWKALLEALPKDQWDHVAPTISRAGGKDKAQDNLVAVFNAQHDRSREPLVSYAFHDYTKVDTDGTDWTLCVMTLEVKGSMKDVCVQLIHFCCCAVLRLCLCVCVCVWSSYSAHSTLATSPWTCPQH
jgi:hypothetical protein